MRTQPVVIFTRKSNVLKDQAFRQRAQFLQLIVSEWSYLQRLLPWMGTRLFMESIHPNWVDFSHLKFCITNWVLAQWSLLADSSLYIELEIPWVHLKYFWSKSMFQSTATPHQLWWPKGRWCDLKPSAKFLSSNGHWANQFNSQSFRNSFVKWHGSVWWPSVGRWIKWIFSAENYG